jgi:hypothetical protein
MQTIDRIFKVPPGANNIYPFTEFGRYDLLIGIYTMICLINKTHNSYD